VSDITKTAIKLYYEFYAGNGFPPDYIELNFDDYVSLLKYVHELCIFIPETTSNDIRFMGMKLKGREDKLPPVCRVESNIICGL